MFYLIVQKELFLAFNLIVNLYYNITNVKASKTLHSAHHTALSTKTKLILNFKTVCSLFALFKQLISE